MNKSIRASPRFGLRTRGETLQQHVIISLSVWSERGTFTWKQRNCLITTKCLNIVSLESYLFFCLCGNDVCTEGDAKCSSLVPKLFVSFNPWYFFHTLHSYLQNDQAKIRFLGKTMCAAQNKAKQTKYHLLSSENNVQEVLSFFFFSNIYSFLIIETLFYFTYVERCFQFRISCLICRGLLPKNKWNFVFPPNFPLKLVFSQTIYMYNTVCNQILFEILFVSTWFPSYCICLQWFGSFL